MGNALGVISAQKLTLRPPGPVTRYVVVLYGYICDGAFLCTGEAAHARTTTYMRCGEVNFLRSTSLLVCHPAHGLSGEIYSSLDDMEQRIKTSNPFPPPHWADLYHSLLPRIGLQRLHMDDSDVVEWQEGWEVRRHTVWADTSTEAVRLPKEVEVVWANVASTDSLDCLYAIKFMDCLQTATVPKIVF